MTEPAIQPTVTQKVRAFLADEGIALPPWSSLNETYAELYALLNRRKDDPTFWPPLARLLQDIVDDATAAEAPRRLPAPQAEVLASWDIDALIEELRRALPGRDAAMDQPTVRSFRAKMSARALMAFLLIGLAFVACTTDEDEGDNGSVECSLQSTILVEKIRASDLSNDDQSLLCSCISTLDASWESGLTQLFETADAQTIAKALEEMVDCVCENDHLKAGSYRADFLNELCGSGGGGSGGMGGSGGAGGTGGTGTGTGTGAPVYKGVSFLDE